MKFPNIKSMLSDDDGTISWSRVASTANAIAVIAWGTHVVIHTHAIPPLTDPAAFVIAPYAVNRVHAAVTSLTGGSSPTPAPPTNPVPPTN